MPGKPSRVASIVVALLVLVSLAAGRLVADIIVAPNGLESTEGNAVTAYPFNTLTSTYPTMRVQHIYDASHFSTLSGPEYITHITFRPDGGQGAPFSSTIPDIQINMSTTSSSASAPDATFANNVGADDTVVVNRGSLPLSTSATGGPPHDFDMVIALDNQFLYDPSAGNLLIDFLLYSQTDGTWVDGHWSAGVGRVWASDVTALTGAAQDFGVVTQFTTVVPEPSTVVLLALGGLGCVLLRRRRSR